MDIVKILRQEHVIRTLGDADPREYALFLGAGASWSSGIPLASDMIREWRQTAHKEQADNEPFDDWCGRQIWFKKPTEYSDLFELLYTDQRARQKYIESKVELGFPGWGYLYLGNIVRNGWLNLIFTTNFDDLVNEALTSYYSYNAVVCAADSEVETINLSTARAKVIKLHGDYLFKSLKNTTAELQRLTENMDHKFGEFARQCSLVVLGYSGADQSIMSLLAKLLNDPGAFPRDIYWGVHDPKSPLAAPLADLVTKHPKLKLFHCEDFDLFMAGLHQRLKLPTPSVVTEPLQAARTNINQLLAHIERKPGQTTIHSDAEKLSQQLHGSIAQVSEAGALDLLDAQIALGTRDYSEALSRITPYVAEHADDARALTIWGSALMIQSEEEGLLHLADEAAAKWRAAIKADPQWTVARYNLVRHYAMRQSYREAIAEAETLLQLVPRDANLKMNLAQMYGTAGRTRDALTTIQQLLADDPDNVVLLMNHAALLDQRGRPVDMLKQIERAVQIAPANPWVRFQAAQGYARTGRPMEAASEFNQAIQLEPRNVGFRMQAAIFFLTANQPVQALPHLREATRLEPDSAELRGWLATTLMNTNALADARKEIDAAIDLDPNESRLAATAGQIYLQSGKPNDAERFYKQAIESNPNAVGPYVGLAKLYVRMQRQHDFQSVMQRIMQIDPTTAQHLYQQVMSGQFAAGPGFNPNGAPQGHPGRF
jgi:tetratricopeptide (TPR) repeat protein